MQNFWWNDLNWVCDSGGEETICMCAGAPSSGECSLSPTLLSAFSALIILVPILRVFLILLPAVNPGLEGGWRR